MRKTERIILSSILALLLAVTVLYAIGSADSNRPEPVYQVSVILGQSVDNLEKGVGSAALALNADVHSVRVAGEGWEAQLAALERELESGADAVILVRCDGAALSDYLDGHPAQVPIVSAEASPVKGRNVINISGDMDALSGLLGEAILSDGGAGQGLFVTEDGAATADGRELSLKTALGGAVTLNTASSWEAISADAPPLLIAANPSVAFQLAPAAPAGARIYCYGYAPSLRSACESGRIRALAVISEFDAGYLALQAAIDMLTGERAADALLPGYLVRPDTLYEPPISTILFPIE